MNTYLYGNGRIAQVNTVTEYFLGDALGSVRQLTNVTGDVTLAKSYDPYGNVTNSAGIGNSPFAYTGEQQDSNGLTYLRARYYNPLNGRFSSRDTWSGDVMRPLSLNRWGYVEGNPVNLTDPTGKGPWSVNNGEEITADDLKSVYNRSPNEALKLLQNYFDIQPPAGFTFRFIRYGERGFNFNDKTAEGYNPWFYVEKTIDEGLRDMIYEGEACQMLWSEVPSTLKYFDDSIFIFDRAFTNSDFHPDDVASVMFHESVHAWQETIALYQVGADKASKTTYFNKISNGLEKQADNYELSINEARTRLSPRRVALIKQRLQEYQDPSPFTLPAGVP